MPSFTYHNVTTTDPVTLVEVESFDSNSAAQSIKGSPKHISICNTDAGSDSCTVQMFLVSQLTTDIVTTGTLSNEADNVATTSSVTLTVDGNNATTRVFLNEKVYKSDGTLFGTCTAVNSATEIVFGGGLEQTLSNNDTLFTGNKYSLLNNVVIPAGATLTLEGHEISYDTTSYILKFVLTSVSSSQAIESK